MEALAASELKRMDTRGLTFPLEIMLGAPSAKRRLQAVRTHIVSAPLPEGSIIDVGGGLLVASPELCLFQLVKSLPLAKTLLLGLEFCGKYALPANNAALENPEVKEKGFKNRPALTSTDKLSSFLARCGGILNQKYSQGVLPYINNGSASPMESRLLIMLTLPYRRGGFGLPMPELDAPVELGKATSKIVGKHGSDRSSKAAKGYRCDLYWRDLKLAAEYDSDIYHLHSEQKAKDSKKKNYLLSKGVHVISVSRLQMRSVAEIERVAQQLAACHSRQLRHNESPLWAKKHLQLRSQLRL